MNNPRIRLVEVDQAQGEVKEVFDEMEQVRGKGGVTPLFRGYAYFPEVLRLNWQRLRVILGGGSLSRKLKECIMVVISELNQCNY